MSSHARRHLAQLSLTALLCCYAGVAVGAPKRPVVAVFTLEAKGVALDAATRDRLSDYLATQLAASGRYQVVPRADLKKRLKQQKKRSYDSCYDSSCQIEIGKELAAEKSLASQVIKLGSRCAVTTTLYDLRRAATERAATAKGACSEDALVASIEQVIATLARGATKTPAPGASPSSPPTTRTSSPPTRSGATPAITPKPRPSLAALRARTEWVSLGLLPGLINGPKELELAFGGSVGLVTLKWALFGRVHLAWTLLEVSFTHGIDDELLYGALSTNLGLAIYLGDGAHHQLRLGLLLGGGAAGETAGFIPAGEAEYRYQTDGRLFFGVGGRLVVPTFSSERSDESYYPVSMFLLLRIGWAEKL